MTDLQIKIVLDDAHAGQTDVFCRSLTAMGFRIDTTLPEIGVIFGAGSAELLTRMKSLHGVAEAVAEGQLRALKGD
jgi:hypothetical protein